MKETMVRGAMVVLVGALGVGVPSLSALGPAWAAAPAQGSQAAWEAMWAEGLATLGPWQRQTSERSELREVPSRRPGLVGPLRGRWLGGRLVAVEGQSATHQWVLTGNPQGQLVALIEAKKLSGANFDELRMMQSKGTWLRQVKRRDQRTVGVFVELRPATVAEVAQVKARWKGLQQELTRP